MNDELTVTMEKKTYDVCHGRLGRGLIDKLGGEKIVLTQVVIPARTSVWWIEMHQSTGVREEEERTIKREPSRSRA